MKKVIQLLAVGFAIVMMLALMTACGHQAEETNNAPEQVIASTPVSHGEITGCPPPDMLRFHSLEELLYAHRKVREGRAAGNLKSMAASIDFASLDELLLPSNLIEGYEIIHIEVYDSIIWVQFRFSGRHFTFNATRWTYEDLAYWGAQSPLSGIMRQFNFTEEDIIYGGYFHRNRTFYWSHGSNRLSLSLPHIAYAAFDIYDLLPFTEITAIDLADEVLISELIGEYHQLNFDWGELVNERDDLPTILTPEPINIPEGMNIYRFITTFHGRLPLPGTIRANSYFDGWYLDAELTIPLSGQLAYMPAEDTTLHARWSNIGSP